MRGVASVAGSSASKQAVERASATQRRSGWSYLGPLLGQRRKPIVVLGLASVAAGVAEAGILGLLAQVATALVDRVSRVHVSLGPVHASAHLGLLLLVALGLAVVRLALQWVIAVVPARIGADLQIRLREAVFAAFTLASWTEQSRDREGHLQELVTNQLIQATGGALQAAALIINLMTFLVLVVSALLLNVTAAVVVLVAAALLFVLMRPLSELGNRYARAASRASIAYAGGVGEAVRVAEETQVFGVGAAQRARISSLVAAVQRPVFRTQFLGRLVPGLYQSLIYLLIVGALAIVYETDAHQIASLGAVVLLLVRAGSYGQQVQGAYQYVGQTLPFLDSVEQARERYLDSIPRTGDEALETVATLAFEAVSFEYEKGRPILSDISFTVSASETVGIVGPTGAGKSTLVQVLLGLRPPVTGRYLVNGSDAENFSRRDWTEVVAYLPQEPRLLHASVADNIRFFRDLDDEAVERAGRLARIHDEIANWPEGYQTIVGPRADAVSGGQQQRICLARALAAGPKVLILDEPTSALDPRTEQLIQESLLALKNELTLFVVAHRMSTLDICDRVMVIVDGRLQAFDTAATLARDSSYYRSATAPWLGISEPKGDPPGSEIGIS